jgi:hypothetical protein
MQFQIQNTGNATLLTIGTIVDNYWAGNCQTFERSMSFTANNADKIIDFKLTKVGFDDYMQINFNNQVVYVGPDGGDHLEVKKVGSKSLVYNGVSNNICERSTNWRSNVDIDLRPYLKEGNNIIDMKVIVSGTGEGWMQIIATEVYCDELRCTVTGVDNSQITECSCAH